MPTTRKQKKPRKSRRIEMLSDIENLDIMLGENHFNRNERDESFSSNRAEMPENTFGNESENNDENRYSETRNVGPSTSVNFDRNSTGGNASAEINRLLSELNSRLSRELDEMMSSVNTQIQRAISDANSSQILPQIQSVLNTGSSLSTQNRWNAPSERSEINSERFCNKKSREDLRSEPIRDRPNDEFVNPCAYDTDKLDKANSLFNHQ